MFEKISKKGSEFEGNEAVTSFKDLIISRGIPAKSKPTSVRPSSLFIWSAIGLIALLSSMGKAAQMSISKVEKKHCSQCSAEYQKRQRTSISFDHHFDKGRNIQLIGQVFLHVLNHLNAQLKQLMFVS